MKKLSDLERLNQECGLPTYEQYVASVRKEVRSAMFGWTSEPEWSDDDSDRCDDCGTRVEDGRCRCTEEHDVETEPPPPICSICRTRHGLEIIHACE